MQVRKLDLIRLWAVSETPNEKGLYDLVPFDIKEADFNQEFEQEDLNDELDALVDHLYGGGSYIEVDEHADLGSCGEFLRVQVGESRIEVLDIIDKINADADSSTTYLLVNRTLKDGTWVIAEQVTS